MGGIAGFIHPYTRDYALQKITCMLEKMEHRGPAGSNTAISSGAALGHLRLFSSDFHYPFKSGPLAIISTGRIFNLPQLAKEMACPDANDGEVLLKAYMRWGAAFPGRLNGSFALAVWDEAKAELLLARDRYGQKPLYYAFQKGMLFFASEQKAILSHPDFQLPSLDLEGLLEYFTFQNFFTSRTLLRGINLFPPASIGHFRLNDASELLNIKRFWDYNFHEPETPLTAEECLEELTHLFEKAVSRQLSGKQEIGSYLSGGLDSGAIARAAAIKRPWLKTFTCGFDLHSVGGLEMGFDERERAEHMSYLFKTEHYQMVLKAGDMERVMPKLVYYLEEPRVGQSYPNFYAAQLVSKFVGAVLSGCGGDELLGGYPWRYYRAADAVSFEDFADKYYAFWQRLIPENLTREVFKPVWAQIKHINPRDIFVNVFSEHKSPPQNPVDYINLSLYFEAKTFLHGLLVVEEKLSLANSLETRRPFLDNDFVDFAMRIPAAFKLRSLGDVRRLNENEPGRKAEKYFALAQDGKMILRRMMSRYLPPEISSAAKQGFSAPDASWFRGESLNFVKKVLYDKKAAIYEFMDKKTVLQLLDEHLSGQENRRLFIWSLLCFEHWLNINRKR